MRSPTYKSSIPTNAKERIIKRYPNEKPEEAEYRLKNEVVGLRHFFETSLPPFRPADNKPARRFLAGVPCLTA
jgi:hypothetical protein